MPIHNRDWYQESSSYGSSYGGRAANATPTCTRILIVTIAVYVAQIVTFDDDVDEVSPIGHVQLTPGTFHLHIRPLNGNVDTLGNGNGLFAYT